MGLSDKLKKRMTANGERRVREAAARVLSGETTKAPLLPLEKSGFPKVLCLDTKVWIELARVYYGFPSDDGLKASLFAIDNAISSGTVVVPVFVTNLDEAAEPDDETRRGRLACFMVGLSNNIAAMPSPEAEEAELCSSIGRLFLDRADEVRIRPRMLRAGMISAYGKGGAIQHDDPFIGAVVTESLLSPEVSVAEMIGAMDRQTVGTLRRLDRTAWDRVGKIRANDSHLTVKERRRLEFSNLWGGSLGERLERVLRKLNVGEHDFRAWLDKGDNAVRFWESVPAIDVLATLMLTRDQNPDSRTHHNDGKDLTFLQLAIPYGNAVVTEKSWAHFANRMKLTEKYDVKVIGNTREIPRVLAEMGCI